MLVILYGASCRWSVELSAHWDTIGIERERGKIKQITRPTPSVGSLMAKALDRSLGDLGLSPWLCHELSVALGKSLKLCSILILVLVQNPAQELGVCPHCN